MAKSELQAYYTKSYQIVDYMVRELALENGDSVLEPCAGDGVFVDAIMHSGAEVGLTAWEINQQEIEKLKGKYAHACRKVRVERRDALFEGRNIFFDLACYDKIIANPPYGAWQDINRRNALKDLFPGMYVRETYSLFLSLGIDLLKPGGRLVFIIPDTYMHLRFHEQLRRQILEKTAIERIIIFPSKFFPGVNFGYANLSIITLRRLEERESLNGRELEVISGLKHPSDLALIGNGCNDKLAVRRFQQQALLHRDSFQFPHHLQEGDLHSITESTSSIGDVAEVVTGFYSGDDRQYLRRSPNASRNAKRYKLVEQSMIAEQTEMPPPLNGLDPPRCFIPIVKGGAIRYVKPNDWFMDWSVASVHTYREESKKARFQNSRFYFKEGIAVPMVTSSSITAALLENRLFDQSIVGIFPHDSEWLFYLLAFFNSRACNSLIRSINPTANNSANYIRRIPFRTPTECQKRRIDSLATSIVSQLRAVGRYAQRDEDEINAIFDEIYFSQR